MREDRGSLWLLYGAFGVAFSVLLVVPIWAVFGRLLPEEEHGGQRVAVSTFEALVREQEERYGLPDGSVRPPPGDVYLLAGRFFWRPRVLRLQAGEEYRLHILSRDVLHGFTVAFGTSSYNLVLMPGRVATVEIRPERPGTYLTVCNEYCGIGHQWMFGRVIVEAP